MKRESDGLLLVSVMPHTLHLVLKSHPDPGLLTAVPPPTCPARLPHVHLSIPLPFPFSSMETVFLVYLSLWPRPSLTNDDHFLGSALETGMSVFTSDSSMVFGASRAPGSVGKEKENWA